MKSRTPRSVRGGYSGARVLRPLVRPMARSLPALTCGMAMAGGTRASCTWPPIMAVTTCGLPA